jgi:hypothetical protein
MLKPVFFVFIGFGPAQNPGWFSPDRRMRSKPVFHFEKIGL